MSLTELFADTPRTSFFYFFYGLTFFFLGISIAVKEMRESELKLAKSLWLLGGFGFTHGTHEWLELFLLLQRRHMSLEQLFVIKSITLFVLILSFFLLLMFGLTIIRTLDKKHLQWVRWTPAICFLLWVVYLWNYELKLDIEFLKKADTISRNTFGLIGGIATAYSLSTYSAEIRYLSPSASKNLFRAGITFFFYAILEGLIPSYKVIPILSFPIVEVFRSVSAALIACFIVKALNIFDVEMRKRIEQQFKKLAQSEKLLSLGQLAAGIAHEINNPLTNASLSVQMVRSKLENKGIDADISKKLASIENNVDRASIIAKELLQFSRQSETDFVLLNIHEVIRRTLTLLRYKFKGITIHQNIQDVPEITGDPGKLEQVFINILTNAVESMPEGGDIRISTAYDKGYVKTEISDTGGGIHAKHLTKVFDPFFTTKEVGKGTGLGLSICYGIMKQHNGIIEISSDEGKGTTVTIKLPAARKDKKKS